MENKYFGGFSFKNFCLAFLGLTAGGGGLFCSSLYIASPRYHKKLGGNSGRCAWGFGWGEERWRTVDPGFLLGATCPAPRGTPTPHPALGSPMTGVDSQGRGRCLFSGFKAPKVQARGPGGRGGCTEGERSASSHGGGIRGRAHKRGVHFRGRARDIYRPVPPPGN